MALENERARFRLLDEPMALELANTVPGRHASGVYDLLGNQNDAVAWLVAEGFPPPSDPDLAFAELVTLRDAVRDTAEALIARRRPSARSLETINEVAARRPATPFVRYRKGRLEVAENRSGTPLDDALGRIARDAVNLFGGPRASHIKRCEGPGCQVLFAAANPRRRWCSPQLCGNRVRVARHYERSRAGKRREQPGTLIYNRQAEAEESR
jgi:predicted RNA-binding Zn ribbon-like protein